MRPAWLCLATDLGFSRLADGGIARRGEQIEKGANPVAFLGLVPEQHVGVDGVDVAPAVPAAGQVSGCLEVSDDGLDRPLGQVCHSSDVPHAGHRVARYLDQNVAMSGEKCPRAAPVVGTAHVLIIRSRESFHAIKHTQDNSRVC